MTSRVTMFYVLARDKHSVVLIDFNKAIRTSDRKQFTLSPEEKILHYGHCQHSAPEVIEGTSK